jgi:hypothetical protein
MSALAAAARQGGDVQQAPAESPQSGGEAVTPNLHRHPTPQGEPNMDNLLIAESKGTAK